MDGIRKKSELDYDYVVYNARKFNREDIASKLENLIIDMGRLPSNKEILNYYKNDKEFPKTTMTISSYFGGRTIKEILESLEN